MELNPYLEAKVDFFFPRVGLNREAYGPLFRNKNVTHVRPMVRLTQPKLIGPMHTLA
jgi:hypothetical protein